MLRVLLYTSVSYVSVYLSEDGKKSSDVSLEIYHGKSSKVVNIHMYAIGEQWYIVRPDQFLWDEENQNPIDRLITAELDISATSFDGWHFGVLCREYQKKDTVMQKYCMTDHMTIGRDNCDIELDDDYISERHGEIQKMGDGYSYVDHSKNGTFVNDKLIHNTTIVLAVGDVLSWACGFKLSF